MVDVSIVNGLVPDPGVYLQLARFFLVLLVGLVITRAVLLPVAAWLLRRRDAEQATRQSLLNLTGVVGLFLSFTVALQAGNFGNLATIIGAVAAALTVAIGFGMRDQVSNVVAGFQIYLYNPFLVGDYIKSEEAEGVVEEITIASTILTGTSSQKIVVPNSQLMMEELKNYTRGSRTKASIRVTLPTDHLADATELLRQTATERGEVLENPAPDIFYSESDGAVYAELHFWLTDSRNAKSVKSDILESFIRDAIEAGVLDASLTDESTG